VKPVEKKSIPGDKGNYLTMKIQYLHNSGLGPFFLEGPEMDYLGIFKNVSTEGKISWSLLIVFHRDNEKAIFFQKVVEEIYNKVVDYIVDNCVELDIYKESDKLEMMAENPEGWIKEVRRTVKSRCPSPIRMKKDKISKKELPDESRIMYVGLLDYEADPNDPKSKPRKTAIKDIDGNEYDWESLLGYKLPSIPCISFESVFSGSQVKALKIRLVSSVLTNAPIPRGGSSFAQDETLQRVKQNKSETEINSIRENLSQWFTNHSAHSALPTEETDLHYGVEPEILSRALEETNAVETADSEVSRESFS